MTADTDRTPADAAAALRSPTTTIQYVPGYSAPELFAAAQALTNGAFRPPPDTEPQHSAWSPRPRRSEDPLVSVWAGHAGAGASTTALAIAEATVRRGCPVRLLDTAAPAWSALAAATDTELETRDGWRRGWRTIPGAAPLIIDRLATPAATPDQVPPPRRDTPTTTWAEATVGDSVGPDRCAPAWLTILDIGWTARELDAHPGGWIGALRASDRTAGAPAAALVLCRGTPQSIRQLDIALHPLSAHAPVVGLVGTGRIGVRLMAEAGPLLRSAWARDAVVALPALRRGLDIATPPLPRVLALAAEHLLERLLPLTGLSPHGSPWKENP